MKRLIWIWIGAAIGAQASTVINLRGTVEAIDERYVQIKSNGRSYNIKRSLIPNESKNTLSLVGSNVTVQLPLSAVTRVVASKSDLEVKKSGRMPAEKQKSVELEFKKKK